MASTIVKNEEIVRPKGNFPPSAWGDHFLNFTFDHVLAEKYYKEIEGLKDEVKGILTTPKLEMVETMDLIDKLERLGISYHFQDEIEEKLHFFFSLDTNYEDAAYDLYTVSTHFRLFRFHGYHITSDIFLKFKDDNGTFKEHLMKDVKGLINLYEAAHLRIRGENILEDGLLFAKQNLASMVPRLSDPIKKQVEYTLSQSLHYGYPRFEIHRYISMYEEDETKNELLLKFAKLDYNVVQMLHKQELYESSKWWRESGLASKVSYARDRIVECYFWAMGASHLPENSRLRLMLTKVIQLLSLTDDTFDTYGTIEELDMFTDAIQRWDIGEMDGLPEYMRPIYAAILKLYEQFREELSKEGRSFAVEYTINAFKEQVRSYNVEAKWFIKGYLPPFSEYLSNALTTCAYFFLSNASLMGSCFGNKEDYEWLSKKPRMIVASMEISRLVGDIGSYKVEKGRGQIATSIDSYMAEHGMEKKETMQKIAEMASDAWKDINKNLLRPYPCSKEVLMILNISRVIDVIYKNDEDGYTHPEKVIKPHIIAMYIEPFKI